MVNYPKVVAPKNALLAEMRKTAEVNVVFKVYCLQTTLYVNEGKITEGQRGKSIGLCRILYEYLQCSRIKWLLYDKKHEYYATQSLCY